MPRRLDDFLEAYLRYTANTESPTSYHTWSAISLLSIALERRVYMRWGHTTIYPNQYIVLIGPSGVRKGEPLMIAREFVQSLGKMVIPEATSKEALISRMHSSISVYEDAGRVRTQCPAVVIAEELSVFLGENNLMFLAQLTNWYDSRESWAYDTKRGGKEEINGVCMNMLASMAPDWVNLCIPTSAIGGGFTSRILFIVEQRKERTVLDPNSVPVDENLRADLEADLEAVHRLVGEYRFSPSAQKAYEEWYAKEDEDIARGRPAVADPRFAGYMSRRATHVKKIGMACSAARSDSMVVEKEDFDRALLLLGQAERNMPEAFGGAGRSTYAQQTKMVLDFIRSRRGSTREEVLRHLYLDLDSKALSIVESTLSAMHYIRLEPSEDGIRYVWLG